MKKLLFIISLLAIFGGIGSTAAMAADANLPTVMKANGWHNATPAKKEALRQACRKKVANGGHCNTHLPSPKS